MTDFFGDLLDKKTPRSFQILENYFKKQNYCQQIELSKIPKAKTIIVTVANSALATKLQLNLGQLHRLINHRYHLVIRIKKTD